MLASDPVWYEDVRVLVRRPAEFFPGRDQSPEERVNSVVRLIAYCTLGLYLYRRQGKFLAFGAGAVAAVSLAHHYGAAARGPSSSKAASVVGGRGDRRAASMGGVRVKNALKARRACTLSTPDNPFANVLLTDLADRPNRPPACKYDDQKDLIRDNFNRGLVRNVYDVYEKENSQRQWMINPVTTSTPDTVAFAQFCYGNAGRKTCKEDPSKCTGAFP